MYVLKKNTVAQWGVFLIVIGIIIFFFSTGMHHRLSLDAIKASQIRFHEIYEQNPAGVILGFAGFYIPVIALNLPGAAVLGLLAGALFGTVTGTVLISFASSIGATLACLLARYLFRDWVQNRFNERLKVINQGIREEGAFYLFSLRLIPVIPFFLINIAMGLTPMRLRTFYWVSQLGMLPGTAVYVNAGCQIAQIDSPGDILSTRLIVSLALLGLLPLLSKKSVAFFRRRNADTSAATSDRVEFRDHMAHSAAREATTTILNGCTECGACVTQCPFLEEYGTPKAILKALDSGGFKERSPAFECSLCHLCSAVCPEHLEPGKMFHALRRQAVASETVDLKPFHTILGYEKRGGSRLFSYYGLPRGCDTVFFPGCTLPGTRPETTRQMFSFLRGRYPNLGIVLDCCTKPSHDLGRQEWFTHKFGEICHRLAASEIRTVLTACPNCYTIFKTYGKGLTVRTVYEELSCHDDLPSGPIVSDEIVVHDPCPLRKEVDVQDAVRSLLKRKGVTVAKMRHQGKHTVCCGEGGSAAFVRPDFSRRWSEMRCKEADGRRVVTYCAGCAGVLNRTTPTIHLADFIFSPERIIEGEFKVSKSPLTYLNRLTLKRHFKTSIEQVDTAVPVDLGKEAGKPV